MQSWVWALRMQSFPKTQITLNQKLLCKSKECRQLNQWALAMYFPGNTTNSETSSCSITWNIEKINGLLTICLRTYNLKRTAPPLIRSYHMSNTHSPKYKMLKHKYQCPCLKITLDFCTVKQSNVQGFFEANWSYLKLKTKRGPQSNNNHFEV